MPTTAEQFSAALDAWKAAPGPDGRAALKAALAAIWPGLVVRIHHTGSTVWAVRDGDGFARFELNVYRKRTRDPELVRLACAALTAIEAATRAAA